MTLVVDAIVFSLATSIGGICGDGFIDHSCNRDLRCFPFDKSEFMRLFIMESNEAY